MNPLHSLQAGRVTSPDPLDMMNAKALGSRDQSELHCALEAQAAAIGDLAFQLAELENMLARCLRPEETHAGSPRDIPPQVPNYVNAVVIQTLRLQELTEAVISLKQRLMV